MVDFADTGITGSSSDSFFSLEASWDDFGGDGSNSVKAPFGSGSGGGGPSFGLFCIGSSIGYTSLQMALNAVQTLTVVGGSSGVTFTWAVTAGGGTLTHTTGSHTHYTAPSSNAGCSNNPTISLSAEGTVCDTLSLAITVVGYQIAYESYVEPIVTDCFDTPANPGPPPATEFATITAQCRYERAYCNSLIVAGWEYIWYGGWTSYTAFPGGTTCDDFVPWWTAKCYSADGGSYGPITSSPWIKFYSTIGRGDIRTPAMIAAGCCPYQLL